MIFLSSNPRRISALLAIFMIFSSLLTMTSSRVFAAPKAKVKIEKAAQAPAVVNVNTAGLEELQGIRGLGPVLAQRVIDYRSAHGTFARLEDLNQVPGIGMSKLQKIKDQISI